MTAACFDFPGINQRLRQMRGEAYSGRYFAPDGGGKYQLIESGHDWDWSRDQCTRCRFTLMQVEDNIGPKVCPGVPPKVMDLAQAMADVNALYRQLYEDMKTQLQPRPFVPYLEVDK